MFLSHKSKYSTFLSEDEIEKRFNHLLTESMISNEQKFSGYFDKHYFVINDNEPSKFGEPATIEGRILETFNRKTVLEITTTARAKSVIQFAFILLSLLILIILMSLKVVPVPLDTIGSILTSVFMISALIIAMRIQYYSLKRIVISTLQLEKS
ncbi:hypothetical protein [Marinoscillum pacificum]|uniref:hypothetical protein n=1 Tax=Marinoscillum pacificum TaxID=392723 RepID=UPI002157691E|nr:hypothetical protein [Marinoscillum pacificum]